MTRRHVIVYGTVLSVVLILWLVPRSVTVRNPVILILLALPMLFGQLKRNWFYGVRTGYSMSSDETWYRQNVIGGVALLAWGLGWLGMILLGR
jgi:uncharacterized membrane protein